MDSTHVHLCVIGYSVCFAVYLTLGAAVKIRRDLAQATCTGPRIAPGQVCPRQRHHTEPPESVTRNCGSNRRRHERRTSAQEGRRRIRHGLSVRLSVPCSCSSKRRFLRLY